SIQRANDGRGDHRAGIAGLFRQQSGWHGRETGAHLRAADVALPRNAAFSRRTESLGLPVHDSPSDRGTPVHNRLNLCCDAMKPGSLCLHRLAGRRRGVAMTLTRRQFTTLVPGALAGCAIPGFASAAVPQAAKGASDATMLTLAEASRRLRAGAVTSAQLT